jgi:hypothetical protein
MKSTAFILVFTVFTILSGYGQEFKDYIILNSNEKLMGKVTYAAGDFVLFRVNGGRETKFPTLQIKGYFRKGILYGNIRNEKEDIYLFGELYSEKDNPNFLEDFLINKKVILDNSKVYGYNGSMVTKRKSIGYLIPNYKGYTYISTNFFTLSKDKKEEIEKLATIVKKYADLSERVKKYEDKLTYEYIKSVIDEYNEWILKQ